MKIQENGRDVVRKCLRKPLRKVPSAALCLVLECCAFSLVLPASEEKEKRKTWEELGQLSQQAWFESWVGSRGAKRQANLAPNLMVSAVSRVEAEQQWSHYSNSNFLSKCLFGSSQVLLPPKQIPLGLAGTPCPSSPQFLTSQLLPDAHSPCVLQSRALAPSQDAALVWLQG